MLFIKECIVFDFTTDKAQREQLGAIDTVISDAIVNLCEQDHQNQVHLIETWLTQRSPENLERLLFGGSGQGFVSIVDGQIAGVAFIDTDGRLHLCYVHSSYTAQGIGRALLASAEQQARAWGLTQVTMTSTATAKEFYLAQGYSQTGDPVTCFGMPGFPLAKRLIAL